MTTEKAMELINDAEKLLFELNNNMLMQYTGKTYDLMPKLMEIGKDEYIILQKNLNAKLQENAQKIIQAVMQKIMVMD